MSLDMFLPGEYGFVSPAVMRLTYAQMDSGIKTLVVMDNMGFVVTRQQLLEILAGTKPFYDVVPDEEIERYNKMKLEKRLPEFPRTVPQPQTSVASKIAGYVYILNAGPYYKIGASQDVTRRIKQLSTVPPFDLELIHTIQTDDMYGLEETLHEQFAGKRKNGEWFELTDQDVEIIKQRSAT